MNWSFFRRLWWLAAAWHVLRNRLVIGMLLSLRKYAERDADPMADGAAENEKMPDEMHVGDFVHDKEDDADCVGNAFSHKNRKASRTERLAELREGDDDHPPHDEIDGQRQNVRQFWFAKA